MEGRTARQCRCRYQKMLLRFHNFNGTKNYLIKLFGQEYYDIKFLEYMDSFENLAAQISESNGTIDCVYKNIEKKMDLMTKYNVKIEED